MNLTAEIQKLQNYLKVEDYKTVVYGCKKLINKFPKNPFLFNLLALALHGNGNYLIAIDNFKKALDLDPRQQGRRESRRVADVLQTMGWRRLVTSRKDPVTGKHKSVRVWVRPKDDPINENHILNDF